MKEIMKVALFTSSYSQLQIINNFVLIPLLVPLADFKGEEVAFPTNRD